MTLSNPSAVVWSWREPPPDPHAAEHRRASRLDGLRQALIGTAIGVAVFFLLSWILAVVAWGVSALLLLAAMLSPTRIYRGIQIGVSAAARAVGTALTVVLLTPLFFLFFMPFRILLRSGRRDRLARAFPEPSASSFWIDRDGAEVTAESYRRQF
jgi:hypothetical protein